jgi:hypothetical protein
MVGQNTRRGVRVVTLVLATFGLVIGGGVSTALAHSEGGMVGRHIMAPNPGATCVITSSGDISVYVKPPTIYATPYDNYSGQYVGWRPRVVGYFNGTSTTVASFDRPEVRLAPEGGAAVFSMAGPLRARLDARTYYVAVDFFFYDTRTGALASSTSVWVNQYQIIKYGSSGQTVSYLNTVCG